MPMKLMDTAWGWSMDRSYPHPISSSPPLYFFLTQQYCTSILETVSHHINTEYEELAAHRLLSIFKMAEVQVIWPDVNGASSAQHINLLLLAVALALSIARPSPRLTRTWRSIAHFGARRWWWGERPVTVDFAQLFFYLFVMSKWRGNFFYIKISKQ
jgi:hypothetical protein